MIKVFQQRIEKGKGDCMQAAIASLFECKITFSLIPHIDFSKLEKVDDENIYKYLNLTDEDIQTIEERCERLKLIKK